MTCVVDASVALKWFLRSRPDEADTPAALDIPARHAPFRIALPQPPHFMAAVCAVLVRVAPQAMHDHVQGLQDRFITAFDDSSVYARALQPSHLVGHHQFDTLHHDLALETGGAVPVAADEGYRDKALKQDLGNIVALSDGWAPA